jgi:hypothetical protein
MRKLIALIALLASAQICWAQPTPACCNLNVGDRVSLLMDNPYGATGLLTGTCGTVICCDLTYTGPDLLFVSWDNWTAGIDDGGQCSQTPPAYIASSGWWIDCTQASLNATCTPAPVCGNGICEPGEDAISCPADCAYCCSLLPGDRVSLLTADPYGATGLPLGTCGTVVCCDPTWPGLDQLFVSWDNYTAGLNDEGQCALPPAAYAPNSGWWVACTDVTLNNACGAAPPICGNWICEPGEDAISCPFDCAPGNCGLKPGDAVSLTQIGTPFDPPGLDVGTCGIVVCNDFQWTGPDSVFVSWMGSWPNGVNDDGLCTDSPVAYVPNSGWWVTCAQLTVDCTCPGVCDLCLGDPNKTDPGLCGCGVPETTAPTITTCAANQTVNPTANCQVVLADLTGQIVASANGCGTVTITQNPPAGTAINVGKTVVTITVTNAAGNTATCTATITVEDINPPTITTKPPAQTISATGANCQAAIPNLVTATQATDDCSPPVTITQTPAAGTLVGVGSHTVTMKATDNAGNVTQFTVQITVTESADCGSGPSPSTNTGACCVDDVCQQLSQDACTAQSGTFQGSGSTCASADCSTVDSCSVRVCGVCVGQATLLTIVGMLGMRARYRRRAASDRERK